MINDGAESPPPLDTGLAELLDDCRRTYEAGFGPGLYEALSLCREFGSEIPAWALDAMIDILEQAFSKRIKVQGLSRLRRELKHYMRWMSVDLLRAKEDLTWDESYEKARDLRSKEGDTVDIEAIRTSYKRIEKRMKTPGDKERIFYILDRAAQRLAPLT